MRTSSDVGWTDSTSLYGLAARGTVKWNAPNWTLLFLARAMLLRALLHYFELRRPEVQRFSTDARYQARVTENSKNGSEYVIGPLGAPLTLQDLPPVNTRWSPMRKAEVVAAVEGGLLTTDDACSRYSLSVEEFAGWSRSLERKGLPALRVTRTQKYRDLFTDRQP